MATIGVRRESLSPADLGRGFEAVHLGHLASHENHIVDVARRSAGRLAHVHGYVDAAAQLFEQPGGELLIDQVVLGQQRPAAGEGLERAGGRRSQGGAQFDQGAGGDERLRSPIERARARAAAPLQQA